jgi:pyruvate formate lyase activating enzyme
VDELLCELRKDTVFFDESGGGVSFSGGEPLSQPEFLAAALDACAREGIHRVVDTSGFAPTEILLKIARKVDLFLFDLKVVDDI